MPAGRRCPKCPRIIPNGSKYCPECQAAYDRDRGTSTARGYGYAHQVARAKIQARINNGETVRCWMCGDPLIGRAWHLDHKPGSAEYRGPACVTCNTSDGGRRAHEDAKSGR